MSKSKFMFLIYIQCHGDMNLKQSSNNILGIQNKL